MTEAMPFLRKVNITFLCPRPFAGGYLFGLKNEEKGECTVYDKIRACGFAYLFHLIQARHRFACIPEIGGYPAVFWLSSWAASS